MDVQQYLVGGLVLIGLVNGINFALEGEWKAFIKFMTAVVFGAVFGYFKFFGLPSIEIGIMVGLSSSGLFKVATKIGGEPKGQPNI